MDELTRAFARVEALSTISMLILSGAGNSFSAGVDIAAHTPPKISQMLEKFHQLIRAVISSKVIVLAVVEGNCLGGAAELAIACDMTYTTESATWGFPEIKLGCFPPVASAALGALVGQKRAADLILTGRSISGLEAAAMGLATAAFPEARLNAAVEERSTMLSRLSPSALVLAKKSLYAWDAMHFEKNLARSERIYLDELMRTDDAQEGIRAFLEKRPPKWTGR